MTAVTIRANDENIQQYYNLALADELIIEDKEDLGLAESYIDTYLESISAEGSVLKLNLNYEQGPISITLYNVNWLKKITVKTKNGNSKKVYEGDSFDELMYAKSTTAKYGTTVIGSVLSDRINENENSMYVVSYDGNDDITLNGGGYHTVITGNGNNKVQINNDENLTGATVVTGTGNDTINITGDGYHYVSALNGKNNVTINGNGGATVIGGLNDDTIEINGDGSNYVSTSAGTNNISVSGSNKEYNSTTIAAGWQDDTIKIYGTKDGENYTKSKGYVNVYAGEGTNNVDIHNDGSVTVVNGTGDDTINITGDCYHYVVASNGDNKVTINGNGGATVIGGLNDDTIEINGDGSNYVSTSAGTNNITVSGSNKEYNSTTIAAGWQDDTIKIYGTKDGENYTKSKGYVNVYAGESTNNVDIHNDGSVTVVNGTGDDTINITGDGYHYVAASNGNNDVTIDGNGYTYIAGGWSSTNVNNITVKNNNAETVISAGEGTNTINLTNSKGRGTVYSGSGNDTITGGDGSDVIFAGAGNDSITGGDGNDVLYGQAGNDTFVFSKNDGIDTIADADRDDTIQINGVNAEDLRYVKNGYNLEIFYDNSLDNNNKIVVQNYFAQWEPYRVENIKIGDEIFKISEQQINVNLNNWVYYCTNYNERLIGSGIIVGIGENDVIDIDPYAALRYERNAGSNDVKITATTADNTQTVTVVDFFRKGDVNFTNGTSSTSSENAEINVNLNWGYYEASNYKEIYKGSGTIKGMGVNDSIYFENGTQTSYTMSASGLTIRGGYNAITIADYNPQNGLKVYIGDELEDLSTKTLTVSGVKDFEGTNIFGSVNIIGTGWNETLKGSQGNDSITGWYGADTISGGKGNDTLSGSYGADTFSFKYGDGIDIIKDATSEDVIKIYTDDALSLDDIKVIQNNDKVEILYGIDYQDKIIIDNYDFSQSGLRNNINEIQFIKKYSDNVRTIYINDELNIVDTHSDTINLKAGATDISVEKLANNLVINYTLENKKLSKTIPDFFSTGTNIKYIQVGDEKRALNEDYNVQLGSEWGEVINGREASEIIATRGGNDVINVVGKDGETDLINAGTGYNTINITSGGNTVIENGGGIDTLVFEGGREGEWLNLSTQVDEEHKSLKINYDCYKYEDSVQNPHVEHYEGEILIKDYENTSVKYIQIGNETNLITEFISREYNGTNGNDIVTSRIADETFNLGAGNDRVIFNKTFGKDVIVSENSSGTKNTDTLQFNNYAFQNGELDFSCFDPESEDGKGNDLIIQAGGYDVPGTAQNSVKYKDFFNEQVNTPNIVIQDSMATYEVSKYDGTSSIDYTQATEYYKNHVAFVNNKTDNQVNLKSNTMYNDINSIGEGGINYTYGGGNDNVVADYVSNDTYNVESFNENTRLAISDFHGEDTLNIDAKTENIRLVFDVHINGDYIYIDDDKTFIHSNNFNETGLRNYFSDDLSKKRGVCVYTPDIGENEGNITDNFGIEHVYTSDNTNGLDMNRWRTVITDNIVSWLRSHNQNSVSDALKNPLISQKDIQDLLACYMTYKDTEPSTIVADGTVDEIVIENYAESEKIIDLTQAKLQGEGFRISNDEKVRGSFDAKKDNNDLLIRYTMDNAPQGWTDEYFDKIIRIKDYYQNGQGTDIKVRVNIAGNDNPVIMSLIDVAETQLDHRNEKQEAILQISGTFTNDYMHGSRGADIIRGEDGDDYIKGESGNDIIYGGAGNDRLRGSAGNDTIYGGTGENLIFADSGVYKDETFDIDYYNSLIGEEADAYFREHAVGSGDDVVYSSDGGVDTIVFNDNMQVSASVVDNDLVFTMSERDDRFEEPFVSTLTVKDYVTLGENHSVKYVVTNWMGEIPPEGRVTIKEYIADKLIGPDVLVFDSNTQLTFSASGNDLVIYANGEISQTLENYFTTGSEYKYIKIGNNDAVAINEYAHIYIGTDDDNNIYASGTNGSIISGGKGDDNIYGSYGNDTYLFNSGDGNDTISNGNGTDTIKFNQVQELNFIHNMSNNDLIISCGNNDSITLKDYFVNNSHSVKTIQNGNQVNTLEELISNNINDIYDYTKGCRVTTIIPNGGNDTLKFYQSSVLTYEREFSGSDLVIRYGSNAVTLKDYYTNDSYSVSIVKGETISTLQDGLLQGMTIIVPNDNNEIDGTNGNDTFVFSGGQNILLSGKGSDTIKFASSQDVTYRRIMNNNSDDLLLSYGNNDCILLKDYFKINHSVTKISNGENVTTDIKTDYKTKGLELEFPSDTDLHATRMGRDLVLSDGNDLSMTIDNYFDYPQYVSDIYIGTVQTSVQDIMNKGMDIYNYSYESVLDGTNGDDTFYDNANGTLTINSSGGTDKLVKNIGENPDFDFERVDNSLIMNFDYDTNGGYGKVELTDWFTPEGNSVKTIGTISNQINIANKIAETGLHIKSVSGNVSYSGTEVADVISAGSNQVVSALGGNDTIKAYGTNSTVNGGEGNDSITVSGTNNIIIGDRGNDSIKVNVNNTNTFEFNIGDGIDTFETADGRNLTLKFNNVSESEVSFLKDGNNLCIKYSENDMVVYKDYLGGSATYSRTKIQTSDSTNEIRTLLQNKAINVLGTDGNDELKGSTSYSDMIYGAKGDDILNASSGGDLYVFNLGDGNDTINYIFDADTININGSQNIKLYAEQSNIIISYSENDSITIVLAYSSPLNDETLGSISKNPSVNYNGTNIKLVDLINQLGVEITGTSTAHKVNGFDGNDTINSGDKDDTVRGGKGDDIINAGNGDDIVYGEAGNDTINGGSGHNTFIFNEGDGSDNIINCITQSEDTIKLNTQSNLRFTRNLSNNDLVMSYGLNDSVTLNGYYAFSAHSVETIINGDETMTVAEALNKYGVCIIGSDENDSIIANKNTIEIISGKGDDTIQLGANPNGTIVKYQSCDSDGNLTYHGNDTIIGATSKDTFYMDIGNSNVGEPRYHYDGNDLVFTFYDIDDQNPIGSVTIKDYTITEDKITKVIVHTESQDDPVMHYGDNELTVAEWIAMIDSFNEEPEEPVEPSTIVADGSVDEIVVQKYADGEKIIDLTQVSPWGGSFYVSYGDGKVRGSLMAFKENNDLLLRYTTEQNPMGWDEETYNKVIRIKDYYQNGKGTEIKIRSNVMGNENPVIMPLVDVVESQLDYRSESHETVLQIVGTFTKDYMHGSMGADIIRGEDGDDYIKGESGDDVIYGGAGNDRLRGSAGNDTIYGGTGENLIFADSGVYKDETFDTEYYDSLINNQQYKKADVYLAQHATNAGSDVIYSSEGGVDTIVFNDNMQVSASIIDNDLVFTMSERDYRFEEPFISTLTVKDYVTLGENHSVKYVVTNWMGEITPEGRVTIQDYIADKLVESVEPVVEPEDGTVMIGSLDDDYIYSINNPNIREVHLGAGDDKFGATVTTDNTITNVSIYGDEGNDILRIDGSGNTIYGGKGNDYLSNSLPRSSAILNNTFVFNNGDGHDTINYMNGDYRLKFADSNISDLALEKFGNDLLIKYNLGEDSITIPKYYSVTGTFNCTIIDKNGFSILLPDFVQLYDTIPESTETVITGTPDDDYIQSIDNQNIHEVHLGTGDDKFGTTDSVAGSSITNVSIYGDEGNDILCVEGSGNTIYGGKGNDYLRSFNYSSISNNTFMFNNGDGYDTIDPMSTGHQLKFADSEFSDLVLEKYGDDLLIKYNSGEDSVAISKYYQSAYSATVSNATIIDKNGTTKTLSDFVTSYGDIPESQDTVFYGTSGDDYVPLVNSNIREIHLGAGDDELGTTGTPGNNITNISIYGDDGNDILRVCGSNNTIYGGKGNDYLSSSNSSSISNNTFVFNNGDGHDTIDYMSSGYQLKFADSKLTDLTFQQFGNGWLIKYNSGKDSVIISGGLKVINTYATEIITPNCTIIDKNGFTVSLSDFVDGNYQYVEPENESEIVSHTWYGTDGGDDVYSSEDESESITTSTSDNDTFYFRKGNDTLTFTGEIGTDAIISEGNENNTDTLIFTDRSFNDNDIHFEYCDGYQDSENDNFISTPSFRIYCDSLENNGYGMGGDITYAGYLATDENGNFVTPNVTIQDKKDIFSIERYSETVNIDWSDSEVSHIAIFNDKNNDSTYNIVSGSNPNKGNLIISNNGSLNYTYQGGSDEVTSRSKTNDTYNIAVFDEHTRAYLYDEGGNNDTLNITGNSDNIRMLFNIYNPNMVENANESNSYWYGTALVHTSNFTTENLKEFFSYKDIDCIELGANQEVYENGTNIVTGYRCGIENVKTTDFANGIDMQAWKDEIISNVQAWLTSNQFESTHDAFENCEDPNTLANLIQCYNVTYNSLVQS